MPASKSRLPVSRTLEFPKRGRCANKAGFQLFGKLGFGHAIWPSIRFPSSNNILADRLSLLKTIAGSEKAGNRLCWRRTPRKRRFSFAESRKPAFMTLANGAPDGCCPAESGDSRFPGGYERRGGERESRPCAECYRRRKERAAAREAASTASSCSSDSTAEFLCASITRSTTSAMPR